MNETSVTVLNNQLILPFARFSTYSGFWEGPVCAERLLNIFPAISYEKTTQLVRKRKDTTQNAPGYQDRCTKNGDHWHQKLAVAGLSFLTVPGFCSVVFLLYTGEPHHIFLRSFRSCVPHHTGHQTCKLNVVICTQR